MDRDNGQLEPGQTGAEGTGPTRGLLRNTITLIGGALAVVSLANIIFLFLIDSISGRPSPYIGIFAYMIMPGFLILGLLLVPLGMLLERNRQRKRVAEGLPAYPRIDLNSPQQRNAVAFFLSFVVVFVLLSAVGSYRAYEFTDSIQFCGQLCHSVMNPEFVAYSQSPHARVRCVDCHVGEGATWYVRSKLSGARQVYATMFNKYPRPIPTPVESLRPAQETCEECHWPRKFHGDQFKVITHFANDEKNTPRQIRLLIKTGGGDPTTGMARGIHWHMNIGNQITYATSDKRHQEIPWVQMKDLSTNETTVFQVKDSSITPEQIQKAPKHRMDCIGCHNRPTHIYQPPDRSVDASLLARRLDPNMPFIKQQAVTALTGDYKTTSEAMEGIANSLAGFYTSKYPALFKNNRKPLEDAIKEVQRIYSVSFFPELKVDWRSHNDNIGHFYYNGCFRCHDNQHVSKDGKVISNDCSICHTIMDQEKGSASATLAGVKFNHPGGELPEGVKCMDCHSGGTGP